ncbi:ABC transporter permease [Candidatus Bipolaricaulota bacterium]|nr:ABC transporter permease [Candidatus Bipolaricaulota bacterium]
MTRILKRSEFYIGLTIVLFSIILSIIKPQFLTFSNWFDLLRNNTFLGILALGELVILVSGGIDVSFTATATVAQYIMGIVISRFVGSLALAFIIPSVVGISLGAVNAVIIYLTGVPAVVITIAMLNLYYGVFQFISGGEWIYNLPESFRNFSQADLFTLPNPGGWPVSLSLLVVFWVGAIALTWFILNRTTIGRKLYAMGDNKEAAERAGFSIFKLTLFSYSYMGFLAGIAGVIQAAQTQVIQPNAIVGRELDVLAAVIIGGASVYGGRGSVVGTALGVLLLAIVRNGLVLLGVSSYWHSVATGLIILIVVIMTALQRRNQKAESG